MKRGRTEDVQFGPPRGSSHHRIITSTPHSAGPTIQYQLSSAVLKPTESISESIAYSPTMAGGNMVKSGSQNNTGQIHVNQVRHKTTTSGTNVSNNAGGQVITNITTTNVITPSAAAQAQVPPGGQAQFQRLKVEDALSYLDQVKFRFGNQPQVYNDFLDIMKEFKSQSIDTPGVIQRVSNLFKGHPELIVGFNTFLPPGYKIEVQANDQGYAFQVSVSVPSTSSTGTIVPQPSPTHKLQILQGTGPIVHTMPPAGAVNLMTHTTHNAPMTPTSGANQQTTTVTNLTIPQSPQNFSRERTISSSSGANIPIGNSPSTNANVLTDANNSHNAGMQRIVPNASIMQATVPADTSMSNNQNQPVEFNHAITYVNKIKNRFQSQPEKYKRFLEILHTYQKEQKVYKEGQNTCNSNSKQLTEAEVYTQVAKLFDNQEDLLREFGQFLPDATSHQATMHINKSHEQQQQSQKKLTSSNLMNQHSNLNKSFNVGGPTNNLQRLSGDFHTTGDKDFQAVGPVGGRSSSVNDKDRMHLVNMKSYQTPGGSNNNNNNTLKRSPSYHHVGMSYRDREGGPPASKRHKPICRDVTLAEASKYGNLNDYAFFDKVRKALKSPEVYDNFLRCLILFNQEVVSKSELQTLVTPFLSKFPDLLKWFQEFLGPANLPESIPLSVAHRQDRAQQSGEAAATEFSQTDLSLCKRLGASYCALPKSHENKVKCSGRTALCRDVLNDTWVSFPTWAEDSTFVTSRKTQYEESIYRCEDERFELDVVIETNSSTIRVLEGVQKKLSRMSPEEVARYRLDDCLGGTSPTIHQRALRRIYGDKAADIILGLKKNPVVAVPVVLRRLKAKEEEWREAQKSFNKTWREQNEKYYLKSLDHQGINFKQNDIKALRSKSLFNEIEALYEERNEHNEESSLPFTGPHMILPYKDKTILDDAANLLIHHVKRQTGIQKQEKARIKHILRQFVPDLFFSPRQQLSDDEREDAEDKDGDVDVEKSQDSKNANKKDGGSSSSTNALVATSSASSISSTSTTASATSSVNCVDIGDSTPVKAETGDNSGSKVCNSNKNNTTAICASGVANINNSNSNNNSSSNTSKSDVAVNNSEIVDVKVEIKTENESTCNERDSVSPPIPPHAVSKHLEEAYTLFFTNQNWYLFLRLHAILCERLLKIYERSQIIAAEEAIYKSSRSESTATALKLKPKSDIKIEDYYPTFLDMLKNVLDGNMDASNYEDTLREMFGIHAYIAFTLDRVVSNAVRQLQYCVTERAALECVELLQLEQRKGGAGGLCRTANRRISAELAYQRKAEAALQEENIFKIHIYKIDCRVTIELLDTETEETSNNVTNTQNWSNYVERLANPAASLTPTNSNIEIKQEKPDDDVSPVQLPRKALFLRRNLKKCMARNPHVKNADDILNENVNTVSTVETTESVTISTSSTTSITSKTENNKITTNNQHNDQYWGKKPPERMMTNNNGERYFVDDQEQVKLTVNTYKMLHVFNKDHIFYNRESLIRAKKTHSAITKKMDVKFKSFVNRWLDRNLSNFQRQKCSDWLMGRHEDLVKNVTIVKQDNDLNRTPYRVYNRYKVERLEN